MAKIDDVTNQMLKLGTNKSKRTLAVCMFKVANKLPLNCRILVIGVAGGYLDITLALTVKERGGMVFSLEPGFIPKAKQEEVFKGYDEKIINVEKGISVGSADDYLYHGFQYKVVGHLVPLPGISQQILPIWNKSFLFDLIVIDGRHTTEAVREDMKWAEFTQPQALIAFDDWCKPVIDGAMTYFDKHPEWKEIYREEFSACPKVFEKK